MSSKLPCGIFGAILFIGLALARALFSGIHEQREGFCGQQAASQIVSAYNLFALEDGGTHSSGGLADDDALFSKGYLENGIAWAYVGSKPYLMDCLGSGKNGPSQPKAVAIVMGRSTE
ncbi:hypothetical protein [Sphingomonas pseudosanguinis]|uniref:Uncharacterized protein n=1 Tax=Sphingomonas pseudosanguinis TaxID=413712 RepID=A0A7W6F1A6_9SPHN|nr:hypothetical protein [Sphingomonas pseudosanguinis]MBB3877784.1 hypothetical protein [Sphingomonas pseudosanguinis]MBN3537659.1 hypothetical protein [Sphingomonas pseudosanguinis]